MDFETVDPAELPEDAHLVDVREQDEWDAGHAPGAQHIPVSEFQERYGELPEEGDVYVVCRTGGRSHQISQWLAMIGYDPVNVRGGMDAWLEAGLPVVSETDAEPRII